MVNSSKTASMKVLVVEDNETDLRLICSVLKAGGSDVYSVKSAEEAMQTLLEIMPDIIVTDMDLPDMDGLTMVRQLKQTPKTAHIPLIAVTSYPDNFPKQSAIEAGFAAYFIKPINTRTLSGQLTSVLKHN